MPSICSLSRTRYFSSILVFLILILCANTAYSQSKAVKILVIGDSLSAGYGLTQNDGLLSQLESWLQNEGLEVEFVNGAVSGDTTTAGLERFAWTRGAPHDALIIELGANDMLRGIDPEITKSNLDAMLGDATDVPVMLWGLHANPSYSEAYISAFNNIIPTLSERYEAPFVEDLLAPIRTLTGSERADFMQRDAIHPNAAGVALIVEAIGPDVLEFAREITPDNSQ